MREITAEETTGEEGKPFDKSSLSLPANFDQMETKTKATAPRRAREFEDVVHLLGGQKQRPFLLYGVPMDTDMHNEREKRANNQAGAAIENKLAESLAPGKTSTSSLCPQVKLKRRLVQPRPMMPSPRRTFRF